MVAYTTWNSADKSSNVALDGTALIVSCTSNGDGAVRSIDKKSTGKFYWEIPSTTFNGADAGCGVATAGAVLATIGTTVANAFMAFKSGNVYSNTVLQFNIGTLASSSAQFAMDCDHKRMWVRKAGGNWNGSATANPATNTEGVDVSSWFSTGLHAAGSIQNNASDTMTANFGASAFAFSVPSGFTSGFTDSKNYIVAAQTLPGLTTLDERLSVRAFLTSSKTLEAVTQTFTAGRPAPRVTAVQALSAITQTATAKVLAKLTASQTLSAPTQHFTAGKVNATAAQTLPMLTNGAYGLPNFMHVGPPGPLNRPQGWGVIGNRLSRPRNAVPR